MIISQNDQTLLTTMEREREFLKAVLDSVEDGIVACDAEGRLTVFNQATRDFHGLPPQTLDMEDVATHYDLYMADGKTLMTAEDIPLFRALRDEVVQDVEMIIAPKQGNKRRLVANGRALYDSRGTKLGAVVAMHDITERYETGRKLVEQELRFRGAFDHAVTGMALVAPEGRWIDVNSALCDMLGYSRAELLATDYQSLTHPDDHALDAAHIKMYFDGEINSDQLEKRYLHHDGHTLWVHIGSASVRDEDGNIQYFVAQIENISERKQALASLKESEQRIRAIFEGQLDAIFYTDPRGRILEANPATDILFGYDPRSLIERNMWILYADGILHQDVMNDISTRSGLRDYEINLKRKDGSTFPARLSCTTQLDETNQVLKGQMWVVRDISAEKHAEARVAASNRQLAASREEERRRMARELHDGTVQDLIGMSYQVAQLEQQLGQTGSLEDLETTVASLQRLRESLTGSVKQLRGFISDLRPAGLEEFGFKASLEGYLAKLERNDSRQIPTMHLDIDEIADTFSASIALCLFRAAQEAVMNTVKHAKADSIRLRVQKINNEAQLIIEDDGQGFLVPSNMTSLGEDNHFGLLGIAERAKLMNGQVSIHSQPGMGTEVSVFLPLAEDDIQSNSPARGTRE